MVSEIETQEFLTAQMQAIVSDLSTALEHCAAERFTLPLPLLSGASIGEHTRHIIEFFQCVANGFETDEVDYASRERNRRIETEKDFAMQLLNEVTVSLSMPNRAMQLCLGHQGASRIFVASNLYREIAYNIEHAIHHMAIIKIGLRSLSISVKDDFGVAPSTIEYRAACAS